MDQTHTPPAPSQPKLPRGRPRSGRKTVLQVSLAPEDASAIQAYSDRHGLTRDGVLAALVKGGLAWEAVARLPHSTNPREGTEL